MLSIETASAAQAAQVHVHKDESEQVVVAGAGGHCAAAGHEQVVGVWSLVAS